MKIDIYKYLNDIFINQYSKYANEDLKWQSGVSRLKLKTSLPYNPVSEAYFTGFNRFILMMKRWERNYHSNGWATFKQIQKAGGFLKKGSKSVNVFRPEFYYFYKNKKIDAKEYQKLFNDSSINKDFLDKVVYFRVFNVFNLDDTKNIKHLMIDDNIELLKDFSKIDVAETIIEKSGAKYEFDDNGIPFYNPNNDIIVMPHKKYFENEDAYYSTFFHELTHWSLMPERLDLKPKNYKNNYAFEELIAELSAQYLSTFANVEKSMKKDTLPYIKGWLKALENDPKYIYKAMNFAQKSSDFLLNKSGLKEKLTTALKEKLQENKQLYEKEKKEKKNNISNTKKL